MRPTATATEPENTIASTICVPDAMSVSAPCAVTLESLMYARTSAHLRRAGERPADQVLRERDADRGADRHRADRGREGGGEDERVDVRAVGRRQRLTSPPLRTELPAMYAFALVRITFVAPTPAPLMLRLPTPRLAAAEAAAAIASMPAVSSAVSADGARRGRHPRRCVLDGRLDLVLDLVVRDRGGDRERDADGAERGREAAAPANAAIVDESVAWSAMLAPPTPSRAVAVDVRLDVGGDPVLGGGAGAAQAEAEAQAAGDRRPRAPRRARRSSRCRRRPA